RRAGGGRVVRLIVGGRDVAAVEQAVVDDQRALHLVQAQRRQIADHRRQVLGRQRRIAGAAEVEIAAHLAAGGQRRAAGRTVDRERRAPAVLGTEQRQRRRRGDDLDVRGRVERRLVVVRVGCLAA